MSVFVEWRKYINFVGESGWHCAINREPGENPGQSRCGNSLMTKAKSFMPLI